MTFPNVNKLLLMYPPSFLLSTSVATFSEPAKSIKFCEKIEVSLERKKNQY
jgi:hypothetical protein